MIIHREDKQVRPVFDHPVGHARRPGGGITAYVLYRSAEVLERGWRGL